MKSAWVCQRITVGGGGDGGGESFACRARLLLNNGVNKSLLVEKAKPFVVSLGMHDIG